MNLYRVAAVLFFVVAIWNFIRGNASMGAVFIALGVVFIVIDKQADKQSD